MDFNEADIKNNVALSGYNTYRVGGVARYFYETKTGQALCDAITFARAQNIAFAILGGGTNMLVPDEGFDGLVIKAAHFACVIEGETMRADAGVSMGALVQKARQAGLTGLEWAAGLPGTLGGAIYGNAGSCGRETKDTVESVDVFDSARLERKTYTNAQCDFHYRHSAFKEVPDVILSAVLRLHKGDMETITAEMKKNLQFRIAHQPLSDRSEGCVFKNVEIAKSDAAQKLVREHPDFKHVAPSVFLSAGLLIDKAGLKNAAVCGAKVSDRHANFIVADDGVTADDIEKLIAMIQQRVHDMFGIDLEEEIRRVKYKVIQK